MAKELYMDDINGAVSDIIEYVEDNIQKLSIEQENVLFDAVQTILCELTHTYDYKNYN